jgi:hypothetical protein
MKKILLAVIIMTGAMNFLHAQTTDFRGFNWGSSLGDVQSAEKAQFLFKVSNDELEYKDNLGGSDCDIVYIFNDNDKLTSGLYVFTKKYSNPQLYIQDYNKFKALLTEKYKKPANEKESWNKNSTIDEKHNYGQAVADGNLELNTVWNTGRSVIKIALITRNDKVPSLQIHYTTRSLDELENKEELKEALKKL